MRNIFYWIIISLSFHSCESFFEGRIIEVEDPDNINLTVHCMLNMSDTTVRVQVGRAVPYGLIGSGTIDTSRIDADIELYQNENLLFDIINNPNNNILGLSFKKELHQPFSNLHQTNATYEMIIDSEKYGILRATQKFPNAVPIDSTAYRQVARIAAPYFEEEDLFQILFTDPVNDENYYWLEVFYDTSNDTAYVRFDGILSNPKVYDALLNIEHELMVFNDKNINGQTHTLNVYGSTLKGFTNLNINYRLHSISKDLYLYLKSLSAYKATEDNPFAEPTLLHHNMKGGLGIFGVYQTEEKRVRIR